jgi:outer membrane protein assembly factor BamB
MNRRWLLVFCVCLVLAFISLAFVSRAADWPQWRGPSRDGVSKEVGLLKQWPESGPKLLWQVKDLGDGFSTPAVVGERLYVLASSGDDNEMAKALSIVDGKEIWSTRLGNVGPNKGPNYPGARSTPTVDGDQIYVLGSDGDLACLETKSGKSIWTKNLRSDFGGKTGQWAYAESPLIDGDTLVCTPGGPSATIVALDKKTGNPIWKCAVADWEDAAYSSVTIVNAAGVKQYIQFLGKGLVGVEAKSGKLLWRYDATAKGSPANIPTPVARKDFVYNATGKAGGLLQLKASDAGVEAAQIYFESKLPTAIGGVVEVDGYLYGTNTGSLMCVDFATGNIKWQDGTLKVGSLLYADGRLYWHGQESGEVALVEATPEAFHLKGHFTPSDLPAKRATLEKAIVGKAWAYPVVANGRLYIRDWNCLWCYDIKDKGLAFDRRP